jgi:hypothetical protein
MQVNRREDADGSNYDSEIKLKLEGLFGSNQDDVVSEMEDTNNSFDIQYCFSGGYKNSIKYPSQRSIDFSDNSIAKIQDTYTQSLAIFFTFYD